MSTGAPSPHNRAEWDSAEAYWVETIPSIEAICDKIAGNLQTEIQCAIEGSSFFWFTIQSVLEEQTEQLVRLTRPLGKDIEEKSIGRYRFIAVAPQLFYTSVSKSEPIEHRIQVKVYFLMLGSSVNSNSRSYGSWETKRGLCKRRTLGKGVVFSADGVRVEDLKVFDGLKDVNLTYEEFHGPETGSMSAPTGSSPAVSIRTDAASGSNQQSQSHDRLGGSWQLSMESGSIDQRTLATQPQGWLEASASASFTGHKGSVSQAPTRSSYPQSGASDSDEPKKL